MVKNGAFKRLTNQIKNNYNFFFYNLNLYTKIYYIYITIKVPIHIFIKIIYLKNLIEIMEIN